MMRKLWRRPSPALIVGCIALVVALAGTSFALPGRDTVDRNDLKENSVGARALKSVQLTTAQVNVDAGQYGEATASCRPSQQLLGGGADWNNAAVNEFTALLDNGPTADGTGWHARGQNGFTQTRTLTVTALCLKK
jgi:hypothetical protein